MDYAKRPLWQWIALYVAIGGVIYAGIYYFFCGRKGGYTVNVLGSKTNEWTIQLNERNASGEFGQVTMTENKGKLQVKVETAGEPSGITQEVGIYIGQCSQTQTLKYPLSPLVNDNSQTVLNINWSQLVKDRPLAIGIRELGAEPGVYVSCGDI